MSTKTRARKVSLGNISRPPTADPHQLFTDDFVHGKDARPQWNDRFHLEPQLKSRPTVTVASPPQDHPRPRRTKPRGKERRKWRNGSISSSSLSKQEVEKRNTTNYWLKKRIDNVKSSGYGASDLKARNPSWQKRARRLMKSQNMNQRQIHNDIEEALAEGSITHEIVQRAERLAQSEHKEESQQRVRHEPNPVEERNARGQKRTKESVTSELSTEKLTEIFTNAMSSVLKEFSSPRQSHEEPLYSLSWMYPRPDPVVEVVQNSSPQSDSREHKEDVVVVEKELPNHSQILLSLERVEHVLQNANECLEQCEQITHESENIVTRISKIDQTFVDELERHRVDECGNCGQRKRTSDRLDEITETTLSTMAHEIVCEIDCIANECASHLIESETTFIA